MTWTLVVLDHGRYEYLARCLARLDEVAGVDFFDRRILALDVVKAPDLSMVPGEWDVRCTGRRGGLTANYAQAWDALGPDEWVFSVEGDFLVNEAPLESMRSVLEARPHLAQMVLERQPLNPSELANGGLLGADNIPSFLRHKRFREQDHLFSFNPFVAHSSVLTVAGTETIVTERLRAEGRTFGFWGKQGDAPRVEHIGVSGGMGSVGWAA